LVELVVVIVIIAILAAIAIPRMSRGSAGAGNSALAANLSLVRTALNLYATEHNNAFPGPDSAALIGQLTKYTDLGGTVSATKTATAKYGPYLVAIPPHIGTMGPTWSPFIRVVGRRPPAPTS
jgi:type II secretory pathway pseudopilin PulG